MVSAPGTFVRLMCASLCPLYIHIYVYVYVLPDRMIVIGSAKDDTFCRRADCTGNYCPVMSVDCAALLAERLMRI